MSQFVVFFKFWVSGPKYGNQLDFVFIKLLLTLWHFQNGLIDLDLDFFPQFAILGTMCRGCFFVAVALESALSF